MKYEVHVLGEKFIVEQGAKTTRAKVDTAKDLARHFGGFFGGVFTLPTTRGDITFVLPEGGIPAWVKPIKNDDGSAHMV
ncbi:hypothetical protein [Actinomyces succiniciruminis]|uniref:Uncharacterized protein n=1 Tax=Actinomyces succiniciruminis TaxID=1522002 RepID=A0A1L7RKG8_9ACTO|nr:hypothetical protein [Actinomyces succiniciruminis]CED90590.1 Hypothetical protein AAM4_0758 [Actinomyces succiniciruminis]